MKIGGSELVNVIHQKAIGKIAINVSVKVPPIRIHQGCQCRERGDESQVFHSFSGSQFLKELLENRSPPLVPAPQRADPIDPEQDKCNYEPAVHVHPDQHQERQQPDLPPDNARAHVETSPFRRIENPEPEQREQPAHHMRTRQEMNHRRRRSKQHQQCRQQHMRSPRHQQPEQRCENRGYDYCGKQHNPVQAGLALHFADGHVIHPFPRKPRLAAHG